MKVTAGLIVLILLLVAATLWRGHLRTRAAEAAFPPTGAFVQVDGLRLHYVQRGAGPDLVLIHGASGSLRDFDFGMMEALAQSYRVTAFDRPGLGWSDALPDGDASLAGQARVLRAAAAKLGITRPVLVGQSYGGAVTLAWALQEKPAALVLISGASMPWPGELDGWYRLNTNPLFRALAVPLVAAWAPQSYVDRVTVGIFAPETPPPGYVAGIGSPLSIRAGALAANLAQVNSLRPQLVDMEPRYPTLTMPVELIHGDADTTVPLAVHSQPLSLILPDSRLTVLPGAGHMPHHTHLPQVLAVIDRAAQRAGLR